jgi:ligand-binding sensor domain-containing protein/CheY-like chemotaxis protein
MRYRKICILSIIILNLLLFSHMRCWAQPDASAHFERILPDKGNAQSIVYCIAQDSNGLIWAGSEEGIIRYNSKSIALYNRYNGYPAFAKNRTTAIFIDSQHQIWAGCENAILSYNALKDEFNPVQLTDGSKPINIRSITRDHTGTIWVGASNGLWEIPPTKDASGFYHATHAVKDLNVEISIADQNLVLTGTTQGLYLLDPNTKKHWPAPGSTQAGLTNVTAIYRHGNHYLAGTNGQGLYRLDIACTSAQRIDLPIIRTSHIKKITSDGHGGLFIATDGNGLFRLDSGLTFQRQYINDVNRPGTIVSNGVYDIQLGQEQILWLATYGGGINHLNLTEGFTSNITHRINDVNTLRHNQTRAILEDSDGNIWFGTREGLNIWYRKQDQWKYIRNLGGAVAKPDIVMTLYEKGPYIWAGTYGNGAFKIDKKSLQAVHYGAKSASTGTGLASSRIYSVLVDDAGNCWLGGIDGNLTIITSGGAIKVFPVTQIRHLIKSRDGSILAASKSGVYRIRNDQVLEEPIVMQGQPNMDYTTINCLYEFPDGALAIGTNGGGLMLYNPATQQVKKLTPREGMPSDIIQGILKGQDDQLWVSTTRGIARISMNAQDTSIRIFDYRDGLAANEFNYGSYCLLSDGTLAFGGVNGVSLINPKRITDQNYLPLVLFDELLLLNGNAGDQPKHAPGNINLTDQVQLTYYENDFTLRFTGILHSAPDKTLYTWKMDGLNNNWSKPGSVDQVTFSNLSPGTYTFRVRASNRDGAWGPERALKIVVQPPWWASDFAWFCYLLLAAGIIYGAFYLTQLLINKKNAEEQINFFSSITHELKTPLSILLSSLSKTVDQDASEETAQKRVRSTIERLNSLFEQLLNFSRATSSHLQAKDVARFDLHAHIEDIIQSMVPLLKARSMSIEVSGDWPDTVFHYDKEAFNKILFNLLSNAIKYSNEGGHIKVTTQPQGNDTLRLSVTDDGIGIPKDQQKFILKRYYRGRNAINSQLPGTGLGLMIVKNLIERDKGSISFRSVENEGTTFTVLLKKQDHLYVERPVVPAKTNIEWSTEKNKLSEYSHATILVVEDNDELRQIFVERVSPYFKVYEATNGREGLDMVAQVFPDIIVTDYIMPDMDGMQLVQALKDDINTSHIPIFMMTVLRSDEHRIESVESSVAAYMEKPIDYNYLLAQIVSSLEWQKSLRERYLNQRDVASAEKYRSQRDHEFLTSLENFVLERVRQEELAVHDLCKHMGMSRTALYMKLKNMVDLSPQNFIIHTRLKYARKLLLEEGINVKEAAYMSGFSNPKYFSTSFKRVFGEPPTSFLKKLEEE